MKGRKKAILPLRGRRLRKVSGSNAALRWNSTSENSSTRSVLLVLLLFSALCRASANSARTVFHSSAWSNIQPSQEEKEEEVKEERGARWSKSVGRRREPHAVAWR